jgi:mannosyltransferase
VKPTSSHDRGGIGDHRNMEQPKERLKMTGTRRIENAMRDHPSLLALGALTLIAFALRVYRLGALGLWLDEALTDFFVRQRFAQLLYIAERREANMMLYYLIMWPWVRLGDSEAMLRIPAAVFSMATVPALYLLGRKLLNERTALIAAGLLAINPIAIQYAQEARTYSLLGLMVVLSSLFFFRMLDRGAWTDVAGYAVFTAMAVYAHLLATLIVAAQWTALAATPSRKLPWRQLVASIALTAVLLIPLFYLLIHNAHDQLDWVLPKTFGEVVEMLRQLAGVPYLEKRGKVLITIYLIVIPLGAFQGVRLIRGDPENARRRIFPLAGLLVPFAVVLTASIFKPILMLRYMTICIPFIALLAAAGLDAIRPAALFTATLATVAVLGLMQCHRQFRKFTKDNWRGIAAYVHTNVRESDAIVIFPGYDRCPFDYYWKRSATNHPQGEIIYPRLDSPADFARAAVTLGPESRQPNSPAIAAVEALPGGHPRTWLLLGNICDSKAQPRTGINCDRIRTTMQSKYKTIQPMPCLSPCPLGYLTLYSDPAMPDGQATR